MLVSSLGLQIIVWGLGFGVWGLGSGVKGVRFRMQVLDLKVKSLGPGCSA